jgi:hypothetical protein
MAERPRGVRADSIVWPHADERELGPNGIEHPAAGSLFRDIERDQDWRAVAITFLVLQMRSYVKLDSNSFDTLIHLMQLWAGQQRIDYMLKHGRLSPEPKARKKTPRRRAQERRLMSVFEKLGREEQEALVTVMEAGLANEKLAAAVQVLMRTAAQRAREDSSESARSEVH